MKQIALRPYDADLSRPAPAHAENSEITFHCGETCPRALQLPEDKFGAGSGKAASGNRSVEPAERYLCSIYSLAWEKTF
jgi:hypothetical protein